MQITKIMITLIALSFCNISLAQSTGGHGGHGGGSGDGGPSCIKAKMSRFKPEHLTSVAPGSEFSFAASGTNGPGHIHVSIKQHPIDVTIEDKDTFYLVKGKLPEDIKNTVVRISVELKSKEGKCDAKDGWLVKVTE